MNAIPERRPVSVLDRPQNVAAGIGLMVLGVFLFSVNDTLGKWLAERYSAPQILLFRSIAALIVLAPILARMGFREVVAVPRPGFHFVRGMLAAIETGMFYAAVAYLPLADAMTYYLASPIYVTLLATLFLGERVGWRRWTAIVVGFVGVVIALQPSTETFGWPALIALAGSVIYAVFLITTRNLRGTPDSVLATWQIGCALLIGVVATPFSWTPPAHWSDTLLLMLLGVVALVAIMCVNRSLKLAPASVVVPYQYLLIVWAVIFGYFVFGDVPRLPVLIGATIIIGAGLYIFIREQALSLPSEPELPPER